METAIVLTGGLLSTSDAKTAHGLIRESERFKIIGIVDQKDAGIDAGILLDGKNRNIPVHKNIHEALALNPDYCIIGVAITGGILPESMLEDVKAAVRSKVSIVNGLHDYLSDRPDVAQLAAENGVELIDIRKPKARADLHFWTGDILNLKTPVVAILGTDCALGKRTTTRFLVSACTEQGLDAKMIYTGQTGWLQGGKHGFIFDSTLNDFVAGELEHAILSCAEELNPDLILIEGQAALRNPSGPCGSELLISGQAKNVILIHSPKRKFYDHHEPFGKIPDIESEIKLIELYGSEVIAVALNTEDCTEEEARKFKLEYEQKLNLPVILPLFEGCALLVPLLKDIINDNQIA